jgi:hypothetical protein
MFFTSVNQCSKRKKGEILFSLVGYNLAPKRAQE